MVIGKSQFNMEATRSHSVTAKSLNGLMKAADSMLTKVSYVTESFYNEKKTVNGGEKSESFSSSLDTASKTEEASEMDKAALGGRGFNLKERRMLQLGKTDRDSERISAKKMREQTLLYLLLRLRRMLTGEKPAVDELQTVSADGSYNTYSFSETINSVTGTYIGIDQDLPNKNILNNNENVLGYRISAKSYEEHETTDFNTEGKVITKDGREISFNIAVSMSRSFYKAVEGISQIVGTPVENLVDPLVINLDSNPASVSDQKFLFDLDQDGKEESISMLGNGSGFLALDRNGDGKINDGSELFGTKSGNGFGDLARFDEDGNGWIDEADEVFEKLIVWTKDEKGNDQMYKLKDLNIGALCLENVNTNFSVKDDNYMTKGVMRHTGFFLYEDGRAGTMQHLDMAT